MKNCKRLSCLAVTLLLCLLLACPAYAVESENALLDDPVVGDPVVDIYAEATEGLQMEGSSFGYALTDSVERVISLAGVMKIGTRQSSTNTLVQGAYSFDWEGDGRYNWQDFSLSAGSANVWSCVGDGSSSVADVTVDFYSPEVYQANEGGFVHVAGLIQFWVWPADFSVNDGSSVPSTDAAYAMYPDRAVIIANGLEWGDPVSSSGNGVFDLSYSIPTDDPVTDLGVRFFYDTYQYKYYTGDSSTLMREMKFNVFDSLAVAVEVPSPGYITEIINEVKAIPSTIYNFFFGDSGDDAASGFKSDVDSAVSSVDQVQQEIVEGLDKPEPDTIVPDLDDVVPQEDYAVYTDIFLPIMQSTLFSSMMLVVVSLAFVSYVLFGKKG